MKRKIYFSSAPLAFLEENSDDSPREVFFIEIVEELENKEKDKHCFSIKEESSYEEEVSNNKYESQSYSTTGTLSKYFYNGVYTSPLKSHDENGSCNLFDMRNSQE